MNTRNVNKETLKYKNLTIPKNPWATWQTKETRLIVYTHRVFNWKSSNIVLPTMYYVDIARRKYMAVTVSGSWLKDR